MSEIGKSKNIPNKLQLPAIQMKKAASKKAKKPLAKKTKEADLNNSCVCAKSSLINVLIFHASSMTIENSQGSVNVDLDSSYNKRLSISNSKNLTKSQKYYATRPRFSSALEESKILDISVADDDKNDQVKRHKHQKCGSCACYIF
ncbi:hypothetical protein SteCoe_8801 [Stentor coeruleus]|uniref:Uncharacterized protein n=1 Tax=Stentor coeruleus TaxID=5963 RepID=A0A1R2CJB1_9CILI|nr:hypothetical protein SteCoe_8801 [Stentor coeruleus]